MQILQVDYKQQACVEDMLTSLTGVQQIYLEGALAQKKNQPHPECHLGRVLMGVSWTLGGPHSGQMLTGLDLDMLLE